MHKSSLQIFCQKNHWDLPHYETYKQGLDHLPKFTATVKVNGLNFQTPNPCGSAKEAQNEAALVAYQYFSNTAPSLSNSPSVDRSVILNTHSADSFASIGFLHSERPAGTQISHVAGAALTSDYVSKRIQNIYKNKLQNYAQKRRLVLPVYSSLVEGPPHAPRFKATVTIDGRNYESAEFHNCMKDAEQDAARVALISLVPPEEDGAGLSKNLLQVSAWRNGFQVPTYETSRSGGCHRPTFVSTVEIGGRVFTGQEAGTKKQAESNAALVAYNSLKDCSEIPRTDSADHTASVGSLHSDGLAVNQNARAAGPAGPAFTSDHARSMISTIDSAYTASRGSVHSDGSAANKFSKGNRAASTSDHDPKHNIGSVISSTESAECSASIGSLHSDRPAANHNFQGAGTASTNDDVPKCIQNVYKNGLQNYAQKRSFALPVYSSSFEGPSHAPRFKAKVTINGRSYESSGFHSSVKDAEQDAARVALISLAPSEEDEAGLLKNLLQVFAQRNGLQVPAYETTKSPGCHRPTFYSTVEIGGRVFSGQEAGSKKQAEINAARVAYNTLKDTPFIRSTVPADCSTSAGSLHSDRSTACQNSPASKTALMSDHVPKCIQNVYNHTLHNYSQKTSCALPAHSPLFEGPSHPPLFKVVTVDGQSHRSTEFHSVVKDADQDAARVALKSLVPSEGTSVQLDETGLLKNLSQGFAQSNGHEVSACGKSMLTRGYMANSVSTLGDAGRVACNTPNDGRYRDCSQLSSALPTEPMSEAKSNTAPSSSSNGVNASPQGSMLVPLVEDKLVVPSYAVAGTELQTGIESVASGYNKVYIDPRSAGRKLEGGSVLPISDGQWIAVKFTS